MTKKVNVRGLKRAITSDCVVKYYAPWCGYCKSMAPTFDQVSQTVEKAHPEIKVVRFNMDKHGDEVKSEQVGMSTFGVPVHQDVKGFPTVILYKSDGSRSMYKGPREADAMVSTIKAFYQKS
jgi:thiol-disulfide isomerase/thioredoxin